MNVSTMNAATYHVEDCRHYLTSMTPVCLTPSTHFYNMMAILYIHESDCSYIAESMYFVVIVY